MFIKISVTKFLLFLYFRSKAVFQKIRKVMINLHSKGNSSAQISDIVNYLRYILQNIITLYRPTESVAQ